MVVLARYRGLRSFFSMTALMSKCSGRYWLHTITFRYGTTDETMDLQDFSCGNHGCLLTHYLAQAHSGKEGLEALKGGSNVDAVGRRWSIISAG
ncbi:hypothetical protein KAM342_43500 [Aeromonas caviae]|uniref:hypothetical protein n=1 Tax=Aeromonas TaxID=642 RepID=UPI001681645B|nr:MULTISPECIES: hypothetical protein [Aeromonas]MCV9384253.1 hypothetical protein [Aeromonas hydrophila]MEA9443686.1 hypothetical protein [Aeromonas caviae]QOK21292.1 hypothetical protein IL332_16405 [Aeromonas caviae]GJA39107.1 hypothetical protein KAM342_43500 [Aeromonas caviae]GJA96471.1 hypothetical protein KAM358_43030 [Aeromonas caviae]